MKAVKREKNEVFAIIVNHREKAVKREKNEVFAIIVIHREKAMKEEIVTCMQLLHCCDLQNEEN